MANSTENRVPEPDDRLPAGQTPDLVGDSATSQGQPIESDEVGFSGPPQVEVVQVEEIRAAPAWLATLRKVWGRSGPAGAAAATQAAELAGSPEAGEAPVSETLAPDPLDLVEVVVGAPVDPNVEPGAEPREANQEPAEAAGAEPSGAEAAHPAESMQSATARLLAGLSGLSPDNDGPGAAAFFDVDNTTIRGSSFVALAKGMAERDYFTTAEIMAMTWKQLKFVVSGTENLDDIAEATENGLEFVKGRDVTEIQSLSDEVYDEKMVNRLWAGTLALTEAHLAAGHQVWLVSATPKEVAEVIAARLGLTGGLGTVAEVVDGRYTGKLQGRPLHGKAKADVVAELAATHGLDLARCSAYSDSANDIPMLSVVGYPVAINPDSKLRAYAKENGWPIRDYRFRGKESVRKGLPAAAAAGLIAGAAVGVAKGVSTMRGRT